jgi:hypothetical protein
MGFYEVLALETGQSSVGHNQRGTFGRCGEGLTRHWGPGQLEQISSLAFRKCRVYRLFGIDDTEAGAGPGWNG